MANSVAIDDVDRNIVELLRENGRCTNQQIADSLGLTAATVSSRIRTSCESSRSPISRRTAITC